MAQLQVIDFRVRRIESLVTGRAALVEDEITALRTAQQMNLAPEVVLVRLKGQIRTGENFARKLRSAERRSLALRLSGLGWSVTRIARALGCADRTVKRWRTNNQKD